MGDILVYVEARGHSVPSISLELLTAGRLLASATGGRVEGDLIDLIEPAEAGDA